MPNQTEIPTLFTDEFLSLFLDLAREVEALKKEFHELRDVLESQKRK